MSDLTPEERKVLSRSIEFRNSQTLAGELARLREEHGKELETLQRQVVMQRQLLTELQGKVAMLMSRILVHGAPTARE
jgi:hypothetical protein